MALQIEILKVNREDKEIVRGVSLELPAGSVQALMGPNGSGKSTLAGALMGHPAHKIVGGRILLDGEDLTGWTPDRRSRAGLFLSFQHPPEIPGVTVSAFLRAAVNARRPTPVSVPEFHATLKSRLAELKMDPAFASRSLNEGFSGGERKRLETLQLLMLAPKYAVLDETDSGLDVDALKIVAEGVERARQQGTGVLVITHHARILDYLKPERIHVMVSGQLVASGGPELSGQIEREGYDKFSPKA
jgi:Fe-S cluster assembly ATP-binding protein